MRPDQALLLDQTRRHFFGRLRRRARLDGPGLPARRGPVAGRRAGSDRLEPARPAARALPGAGQERHLPVHGRRAQPARAVRLQARAPGAITASRSPSRSSRASGSPSWTRSPRSSPSCWATNRKFAQHGAVGGVGLGVPARTSAEVVDDLAFIRSVATDVFNHAPAKLFANTGSHAVRPAEHGVVGHLRDRQRVAATCPASSSSSPAREARAAGRSTGGAGSCPRTLSGRAAPLGRRADPRPGHARAGSPPPASGGPSTRSAT